jgi:hypothetical protein
MSEKPLQPWIIQGFQSGPVPGTFTRLRWCIVPVEITEPPKIIYKNIKFEEKYRLKLLNPPK